jgi:hypothetical protein
MLAFCGPIVNQCDAADVIVVADAPLVDDTSRCGWVDIGDVGDDAEGGTEWQAAPFLAAN